MTAEQTAEPLEFSRCTIGSKQHSMDAECSTVAVPIDPDKPDGELIQLRIAKLKARTSTPQPDAFTLIAGGPGQSALESYPSVANAFHAVLSQRDIILVDQRGTGESQRLDCAESEQADELAFDAATIEKNTQACLEQQTVDTRFFTTSIAVQDLELVRQKLGINQWNLYGISYGTRVALHYLRRFPDSVRTLLLDAVLPPEVSLGPNIAITAQQSLDKLFERCKSDDGCHQAFPDLKDGTHALLASLKANPKQVQFEDFTTGLLRDVKFSDKHLAVTLRLMSYSAYGNAILPSMLYDSYQHNHFAPMARQAEQQASSLDGAIASGMHNAVICTEDAPFINEPIDTVLLENTYLGADLLKATTSNCNVWPQGIIDDDFKTPVVSDVPTLLLSGSADPITPPEYGDQVAKHLSQSVHLVNQHQGHMQAILGCTPSIIGAFVSTGSVENLPTQCLERLRPPAFFINANGPLP